MLFFNTEFELYSFAIIFKTKAFTMSSTKIIQFILIKYTVYCIYHIITIFFSFSAAIFALWFFCSIICFYRRIFAIWRILIWRDIAFRYRLLIVIIIVILIIFFDVEIISILIFLLRFYFIDLLRGLYKLLQRTYRFNIHIY